MASMVPRSPAIAATCSDVNSAERKPSLRSSKEILAIWLADWSLRIAGYSARAARLNVIDDIRDSPSSHPVNSWLSAESYYHHPSTSPQYNLPARPRE